MGKPAGRSIACLAAVAVGLALVAAPSRAQAPRSAAYDGDWFVTLTCSDASDGAKGYIYRFGARVVNGVLHGEHGTRNQASWLALDGRIASDGSATLAADGLTGSPEYSVGRVNQLSRYHYTMTSRFTPTSGSGTRVELRPCSAVFARS